MLKRKYVIKAECPQCASDEISLPVPEKLHEAFVGDEEEVEVLCPVCGTKYEGKLHLDKQIRGD